MPNWCECDLRVEGNKAEIEKFKEAAKTQTPEDGQEPDVLDAESFIPYPARFKALDDQAAAWARDNTVDGKQFGRLKEGASYADAPKDGFNSGGYDWCCENWGTKWGISRPELVEEDQWEDTVTVTYTFQCAWSPCTPVIAKMSEMFPTLEFDFRFFERGMAFNGWMLFKNGELKREEEGKYFGTRGG